MATIDEIARRAKVSKTAVSFVINGKPGVGPETTARIRKVMAELDYVPSARAQRFAAQRSLAVAVVARDYPRVFFDPRLADMIDVIYGVLEDHGYALVLGTSNQRFVSERRHMTLWRSGQVDGLLLLEPTLDQQYVAELGAADAPAVVLNSDGSQPGLDAVRTDDGAVGRIAAEHLLSLGHRRVGMIGGSPNFASARDRLQGFSEALDSADCPLTEERLFSGRYETGEKSGADGCRAILAAAPDTTAIFCCNSTMAQGALPVALEMGYEVPDRLSLLGVDDAPRNVFSKPRMTTICQDAHQMARRATELLLERIASPADMPPDRVRELVPPTLLVRESSGPPREG